MIFHLFIYQLQNANKFINLGVVQNGEDELRLICTYSMSLGLFDIEKPGLANTPNFAKMPDIHIRHQLHVK